MLVVVYLSAPWFIGPTILEAVKTAPWLAYIFFVQNLFHLAIPPAIGPTWSLAIEEQYYFLWAPVVRFFRPTWALVAVLGAALVGSPAIRSANLHWLTKTHTLIHLDGIALGSLMAFGLYTLALSRNTWLWIGLVAMVLGFCGDGHHRGWNRIPRLGPRARLSAARCWRPSHPRARAIR